MIKPMINWDKLCTHNEEGFQEFLANIREERRLRETFGPPKPLIDPKCRMSKENKQLWEDDKLSYQLDKIGYGS